MKILVKYDVNELDAVTAMVKAHNVYMQDASLDSIRDSVVELLSQVELDTQNIGRMGVIVVPVSKDEIEGQGAICISVELYFSAACFYESVAGFDQIHYGFIEVGTVEESDEEEVYSLIADEM